MLRAPCDFKNPNWPHYLPGTNPMHRNLSGELIALISMAFLVFALNGCAPRKISDPPPITVEGEVMARGNEPFAAYVLETPDRNFYVLRMSDSLRADFSTPALVRVTGRVYLDEWDGRPFAHIDVQQWERR